MAESSSTGFDAGSPSPGGSGPAAEAVGRRRRWWMDRDSRIPAFPRTKDKNRVSVSFDGTMRVEVEATRRAGAGDRGANRTERLLSPKLAQELRSLSGRLPTPPAPRRKSWRGDEFVLWCDSRRELTDGSANEHGGGRVHRLYRPGDGGEAYARGVRYARPCRLCRTDFALFPGRRGAGRWARFSGGPRIGEGALGLLMARPDVDLAAHQLCMDYAMGEKKDSGYEFALWRRFGQVFL